MGVLPRKLTKYGSIAAKTNQVWEYCREKLTKYGSIAASLSPGGPPVPHAPLEGVITLDDVSHVQEEGRAVAAPDISQVREMYTRW